MTLRSLEIFVSVVELGSMSAAARSLLITQSSVSQVILDIEKEYGVMLFERLSHGLHLTHVGKKMFDYSREILRLYHELEDVMKHESEAPHIKIGATVTVGTTVIEKIIFSLRKDYPDISCDLTVANTRSIEEKLLSNDLDVGLVEGTIENPNLVQSVAMEDTMVLICGDQHPFWGRKSVSINELANETWVLREEGSGTRAQIVSLLKQHGIVPEIPWCSNNFTNIKHAVAKNMGVSIISRRLALEEYARGDLWICDVDGADFSRTFKLVYHKNKFLSDTISRFNQLCFALGKSDF